MSGFTAEEALEFQGTEDAEMIAWDRVEDICKDHDADLHDFINEQYGSPKQSPVMVDAGDLLAWLGY